MLYKACMAYVLPLMSTMAAPSVMRWTFSSANADSMLGRCRGANILAVIASGNVCVSAWKDASQAVPQKRSVFLSAVIGLVGHVANPDQHI